MKKTIVLCVVAVMIIVLLYGCSQSNTPSESTTPEFPLGLTLNQLYQTEGVSEIWNYYYLGFSFNYQGHTYVCTTDYADDFYEKTENTYLPQTVVTNYQVGQMGELAEDSFNSVSVGDSLFDMLRKIGPPAGYDLSEEAMTGMASSSPFNLIWNLKYQLNNQDYLVELCVRDGDVQVCGIKKPDDYWLIGLSPERLIWVTGVSNIGNVYGYYYWFDFDGKFYFCKIQMEEPFVVESYEIIQLRACTDEVRVGDTIELVFEKVGLPICDGTASSYISSYFETAEGKTIEIKWNIDAEQNLIVGDIKTL